MPVFLEGLRSGVLNCITCTFRQLCLKSQMAKSIFATWDILGLLLSTRPKSRLRQAAHENPQWKTLKTQPNPEVKLRECFAVDH